MIPPRGDSGPVSMPAAPAIAPWAWAERRAMSLPASLATDPSGPGRPPGGPGRPGAFDVPAGDPRLGRATSATSWRCDGRGTGLPGHLGQEVGPARPLGIPGVGAGVLDGFVMRLAGGAPVAPALGGDQPDAAKASLVGEGRERGPPTRR